METQVLRRLFSVDEFHQMAAAGVFGEDDRLELLDGEIVRMTPIGSRHAGCVARLTELLGQRTRATAIVSVQHPLALDAGTEVYPDIMLLRRRADFYGESLPSARDVLLVIEVADTSADYEHTVKVPRYARAGVPQVCVVDLRARAINVYRDLVPIHYRFQRRLGSSECLPIPGIEGEAIAVTDVLA